MTYAKDFCEFINFQLLNKLWNIRTYLKNNLSAHGGVAKRFKMLTYYVYATLFHRFAPCPEH
jgi:O-glycosyl hydrolase